MARIQIQQNSKTYKFLQRSNSRTNILYGGAGSGKSWSIAQFLLIDKLYTERNIRVLVTRKTRPALKKSAWLLCNDLLTKYNLPGYEVNKSDLIISANGNQMYFTSIDDPEKLKSFEKINYIWSEESTELSKTDYMQLHLRCRGKNFNGKNQLFFSFNPVDELSFLKAITESPPDGTGVQHSTYHDNRFLDVEYVDEIERLKEQDATYHKIYAKGEWATPTNIIYERWDVVDEMCVQYDDVFWGLDFGYSSNPAALIEMRMVGEDEVWEREHIYEAGLTNPELIEKLRDIIVNKNQVVVADSAEPKSIQEIKNAGFNIFPCKKGTDSVRFGVNAVKSVITHLTKDSTNLIREKRSYKWKEDKDGNVLAEPVKFHDHLMDAERYVMMRMKGKVKAGFKAAIPVAAVHEGDYLLNSDEGWIE